MITEIRLTITTVRKGLSSVSVRRIKIANTTKKNSLCLKLMLSMSRSGLLMALVDFYHTPDSDRIVYLLIYHVCS
jgi:hypothetical protein